MCDEAHAMALERMVAEAAAAHALDAPAHVPVRAPRDESKGTNGGAGTEGHASEPMTNHTASTSVTSSTSSTIKAQAAADSQAGVSASSVISKPDAKDKAVSRSNTANNADQSLTPTEEQIVAQVTEAAAQEAVESTNLPSLPPAVPSMDITMAALLKSGLGLSMLHGSGTYQGDSFDASFVRNFQNMRDKVQVRGEPHRIWQARRKDVACTFASNKAVFGMKIFKMVWKRIDL